MVVSGIERVAKPEPASCQIVLDRYGLAPASTLFVDDHPDNLAPAAALGVPDLLFESAARLEGSLVELGLLPGAAGARRGAE